MSIQGMSAVVRPLARPPIVLLVAAAVAIGAGSAWALTRPQTPAIDQARSAHVAADEARATATALSSRLDRLQEEIGRLELRYERFGRRLAAARADLRAALERLRSSLADARQTSRSAGSQAQDAIARVENAARQLSVLEDRFEYHLQRDHGGG